MQPLDYFELIEMFPQSGCVVCNLLLRDVYRYLDGLLYEYVLDPDVQRAFQLGRGLCNEHSWLLCRIKGGNSLGIALLYRTTVGEVLKIIDETPLDGTSQSLLARLVGRGSASSGSILADRLEAEEPCIVCESQIQAERRYLDALSKYATDHRLREAYDGSDGLCLPHFRQVLGQTRVPANLQQIVSTQKAIWDKLHADLEECIAKNDYRRIKEPAGPESSSWSRAPRQMAGERGVFGLDHRPA